MIELPKTIQEIHGLSQNKAKSFFQLETDIKKKFFKGDKDIHGYYPLGRESHSENSQVTYDTTEFWMVSNCKPDREHLWPDDWVPGFQEITESLYEELVLFSKQLTFAFSPLLSVDNGYLHEIIEDDFSGLRLLNYPETKNDNSEFRAYPHKDMCLFALFLPDTSQGLQLLDKRGQWQDLQLPRGKCALVPGQMLEIMTNGRFPAVTHRVKWTQPLLQRQSTAFFFIPNGDKILKPFVLSNEEVRFPTEEVYTWLVENLYSIAMIDK